MSKISAFFARQKDGDLPPIAGLLIFVVLGYLPISSGLLALKNDDIIYFLPYRYNIAEIIRSGHLPLWSPYIYMGFPIAGDMQSGAWNPLVWLLSLTGKYDHNRLAFEILFYLFMAGVGLYKLGRVLNFNKIFAFTIGMSFMFCGFMTDSGQILSWVACAAMLPFTYLYFIRLFQAPGAKNAVKFSLANVFLALAGYPAFFIINSYILLLICLLLGGWIIAQKNYLAVWKCIPWFLLSAGFFLFTGMIAWLSFAEMLPYYSRGNGVTLADALEHSYQTWFALTAFTPFSHTWETVPAAGDSGIIRNIYFGILLIPFAVFGAVKSRTLFSNVTCIITALVFASSLGNDLPFRSFEFDYLPLMNSFRHPANFRVFVIIGLLLLSGKGLQQVNTGGKDSRQILRGFLLILIIGLAIVGVARSVFYPFETTTGPLLHALTHHELFNPALIANILFQLLFLIGGFMALRRGRYRMYCLLSMVNVLLLAEPQIFYGMVSSSKPGSKNNHIKHLSNGFPIDINDEPIGIYQVSKKINNYGSFSDIGSFYMKRPVINRSFNNPTILSSYNDFLQDTSLVTSLSNYPAVFFGDSIAQTGKKIILLKKVVEKAKTEIAIRSFGPNEISFSVKSEVPGMMSVFQNNYPGWKAFLDDKPVELVTVNHTFMGITAPAGSHKYQLKYRPWWLLPGIASSLLGIGVCAWLLVRNRATSSGTSFHNPY